MLTQNSISGFLRSGWSIVVLCSIWLLPGLIGHDPWKADEPYSFGMVYHILTTGDWVVPTVAGEPFMEKPPIFYLTASVIASFFYPLLPLHDGARLACAFFMLITFLFTALAGRELYGKGYGRIALLILLGSAGLVNYAHKLLTDVSLLTGFSIGLYGLILSRRRPFAGGFFTGTGVGLGFMSKGLLAPGLLGLIALVLPFWCREWRNRTYLLSLVIALGAALPWFLIWPLALYQRAPHLFREWFWIQNFGRYFGFTHQATPNKPGFYLFRLLYFAWPAVPLSLLYFRDHLRSGKTGALRTFPFIAFFLMLVVFSFASDARTLYALPMLLPLSLLAVPAVDVMTPTIITLYDKCSNIFFGFVVSLLWFGWLCIQTGYPQFVVKKLLTESPAYLPSFQPVLFTAALLLTLLWLVVVVYRVETGGGVVFRWGAGLTLVWALMMTLWLPFVDAARSYRPLVREVKKAIPDSYNCIAGKALGESERAMLEYFGGIRTVRVGAAQADSCNLLLVAAGKGGANGSTVPNWEKIWEGSRPGHKTEVFMLYQVKPAQNQQSVQLSQDTAGHFQGILLTK